MYKIEYAKEIKKDPSNLSKEEIRKILLKIDILAVNPRPEGVIALQGNLKGLYRI